MGSGPPTPENHKNIGFLSNTGPGHLNITRLPSQHSMLRHHRHAIETPLNDVSLAGDDCPLILVFGSSLPASTKKRCQSLTPYDKTFWILA